MSEHLSRFVSVKREEIDIKVMNIFQRDYSSFTNESFRDDISIQKWNYSYNNVQDLFNDFYVKLDGDVNRHAPLKKLSPKEIKAKFKPWVSGKILKMINVRDKAYARKKRQPNNENCKRLYNLFRNRVNRKIKKSKKQYYAEYFAENVNNIKKTWDGIRKIVNIKKKAVNSTQLNIGGKIVVDDKEVASHFNKFFVNVGPSTEKTIPKAPEVLLSKYLRNCNQMNFIIAHISNEEILDIINSLENKSTGPTSIPLKLLSLIPDLIITPLAYIINLSLTTGEYPELLKVVKVIPIHKGGSTQDVNNSRPISLLSIFDNIIEKIVHKNLYFFLEVHNILFGNQFGFRKNNSTTHALIQIKELIKKSIDKCKYGCGIFMDLRKPFDTVNHEILLTKPEHYGIRGNMLDWFRSYLSKRKQYISINGQSSELLDITCGGSPGVCPWAITIPYIHK